MLRKRILKGRKQALSEKTHGLIAKYWKYYHTGIEMISPEAVQNEDEISCGNQQF